MTLVMRRQSARSVAALGLLLMALVGFVGTAHAATSTLFDNTSALSADGGMINIDGVSAAQSFTTGTSALSLNSVSVRLRASNASNSSASPGSFSMALWTAVAGKPGALVATIMNAQATSPWSDQYWTFSPSTEVSLTASTTYFIVLRDIPSGTLGWKMNSQAPLTDVSPTPTFASFVNSGSGWVPQVDNFLMQVKGLPPTAPTLTDFSDIATSTTACTVSLPTTNSSPAGTWSYQSSDGSVASISNAGLTCLQAGTVTVTATFTPSDPGLWTSASKSFQLTLTAPPTTTTTTANTTTTIATTTTTSMVSSTTTTLPTTTTTIGLPTTTVMTVTSTPESTTQNMFSATDPSALNGRIELSASGRELTVTEWGSGLDASVPVVTFLNGKEQSSNNVRETGEFAASLTLPAPSEAGAHLVTIKYVGKRSTVELVGGVVINAGGQLDAIIQPQPLANFTGANDARWTRAVAFRRPIFDPTVRPHSTALVLVAAGGLLALAGAGGVANSTREASERRKGSKVAKVANATTKKLKAVRRDGAAWGDQSRTWRSPWTARLDGWGQTWPARVGPYSAVIPRVLADGAWLRAIFGGWSIVAPFTALVVGVMDLMHHHGAAYLPSTPLLLTMVAIGILDALSGATVWVLLVLASLVTGGVTSWTDLRSILGAGALIVSIPLLAHAIRPLRRLVIDQRDERWERFFDFAIMPVFLMFAGSALGSALNGLSGLLVFGPSDITHLRVLILAMIAVRLVGEDLAISFYPVRTKAAHSSTFVAPRPSIAWSSVAFKAAVYLLALFPYFGISSTSLALVFLVSIPNCLKVLEEKLPNVTLLHKWLPRGLTNFLATLVIGALSAKWILGPHPTPELKQSKMLWLLIPGVTLSVLAAFGREGGDWTNVQLRRGLGVVVWLAALGLVTGYLTL